MIENNIVLYDEKRNLFCLRSIRRIKQGCFAVVSKTIRENGCLASETIDSYHETEKDAKKRCKSMARIKKNRHGYVKADLKNVPDPVLRHLEIPIECQCTPEELVKYISDLSRERYVVLNDVFGIEDFFDLDVQYIGYETDSNVMKVYDRNGYIREVFKERIGDIELSDRAKEVSV